MDKSNGNSFTGTGFMAPDEDPKIRSLPPILRLAIPGYETGWPCR